MTVFEIVESPLSGLYIAPPKSLAVFDLKTHWSMVAVESSLSSRPPPRKEAELPSKRQFVS